MAIGLIFTICTVMAGGVDECDNSYVLDAFSGVNAVQECLATMDSVRSRYDDRYLSCGKVDTRHLINRAAHSGLTVQQQIDKINGAFPYLGSAE